MSRVYFSKLLLQELDCRVETENPGSRFFRYPWPSSFAIREPYRSPLLSSAHRRSAGTRSPAPADRSFPQSRTWASLIFSMLFIGAIFSRNSRIFGSRSSPYSTRRKSRRYASVCSRNVTRFDMPTMSTEQRNAAAVKRRDRQRHVSAINSAGYRDPLVIQSRLAFAIQSNNALMSL